ncbi:MAG: CPBP family intramembrane metalloprotease [bacterium]|nr:CPBP family intramembrane metalloprotease [bacterium]
MKKVTTIIETALFAVILALAYYFLAPALTEWAGSIDSANVLSGAGHSYIALLIINAVAAIEIAFFYRLRKLGAENLGLRTGFVYSDIAFIPFVAGVALCAYWLIVHFSGRLMPFDTIYIPTPQTTPDWIAIILLIAITAVGAELFLRGFVFNLLHNKRAISRWIVGFYIAVLSFALIAFCPANGLGFAAASIPFTVSYIVRRNFRGSVVAHGLFLAGVVFIRVLGGFNS